MHPNPPVLHGRRRFRWSYVFLGLLCVFCIGVIAVILSFRMGDEARVLRRAVFKAAPGEWERQIEIGVGRLPVFAAQAGLNLLDLDPPARAGIRAFRSGDVGVYRRRGGVPCVEAGTVLAEVNKAMDRRGWDSIVTVADGRDAVAIFAPANLDSLERMRACVLVMHDEQLVLVSVRANVQSLVELIMDSLPEDLRDVPGKWSPESIFTRSLNKSETGI